MFHQVVCLIWILLAQVLVHGKIKVSLEAVETNCDHDFVEYFRKVPNQEALYTFRVVKTAPKFTITITMRALKSQRVMYNVKNIDGCQFISNPFMNKILSAAYRTLVGNNSFFKCPIPPKIYYLNNLTGALIMPSIHPLGRYQLSMQVKMSQSSAPFIMEVLWKYKIMHTK